MSSASFAAFLINALVQVPVIALVAIVAARAMRLAPARQQHRVWIGALAGCVLLPLASMLPRPSLWSGGLQPAGGLKAAAPQGAPAFSLDELLRHTQRPAAGGVNIAMILGVAYAAFILYRVAALGVGWLRMRRILRGASPHAIESGIPILASDEIVTPLTVGARRPVIIFPRALLGELSDRARLAIIGHERAHIERRDFLTNLLLEIVTLPISFHPLTAVLKRRLAESRELACDEQVTPGLVAPRDYARILIDVAAFACAVPRPAYSLTMAGGDFEDRIRRIVRRSTMKHSRILIAAAWVALAVSSVAAAGIAVHPRMAIGDRARFEQTIDVAAAAPGTPAGRAAAACKAGRERDAGAIPMLLGMLGDETPIAPVRCYGGGWSPRLDTLGHPSPGEQAALALASISRPAVGALVRALDDRAPAVRRNAAWAVGEVRGAFLVDRDDALAPLIRLLADADAGVRRAAAFGLSELKSRDSVEPLIVSLADRDVAVRGMAVFALGEIRDRRATPQLAILVTTDPDSEVRRAAAWALGEIKDDRGVDALRSALGDPRVRDAARRALSEIQD